MSSSLPPSAGFLLVLSPADYDDDKALVVRIPRGIRSKQKLLSVLADKLRFPDYFGRNWDALEECLGDLSWLPDHRRVAIVHRDLPFGLNSANRTTYLEILRAWTNKAPAPGQWLAIFPDEARGKISPAEAAPR